jgi:hypothetical protein
VHKLLADVIMRELWSADCETDPFAYGAEIEPFIWGAYNGSEYHEFATPEEFVEFFKNRNVIVYAHNGGRFDWHFLTDYLEPFSPIKIIGGRLAQFKIGECEFRDSYNILPAPLAQLTASEHKQQFDYNILKRSERNKTKNRERIRDYLRADCVELFHAIRTFVDRFGLHLTFASAALKMWQKIEKTTAPETCKRFYDDLHPYYYGGRVECFHVGQIHTPFTVIDINSAYPHAMKHLHGCGEIHTQTHKLPTTRDAVDRAFISLECESRGAFPYRDDNSEALSFPNDGQVRPFHITGWEFNAAKDLGLLRKCKLIEVLTLDTTIRFNEYIDYFFAEKARCKINGDVPGYNFAKFFLNGLYGKFAANPDTYLEYEVCDPLLVHGAQQEGYDYGGPFGRWAIITRPAMNPRYYNVGTGASITGFVRAYLLRALKGVDCPLYCDTDAIAFSGRANFPVESDLLGQWNVEAHCIRGGIAGKKLYAFERAPGTYKEDENPLTQNGRWKIASKGAKLSATEIMRVAKGGTVEYASQAPTFSVGKVRRRYIKRTICKTGEIS